VARTTKKRRRKHRGTQGGSIDRRGRAGRPRSREEARARARKQMGRKRADSPPTWTGALGRAAFGAAIFFILLILIFKRPIAAALLLSLLMMLVYIPLGHAIDGFMYRRRLRARQREAEERKARS
jgi:drug/metabolite transporter (DMT)-like permease